jgi:hypothetical protein
MALYLCVYSKAAVALFGPSQDIKAHLKDAYGGKYNPHLTDPSTGLKSPGWIFKRDLKDQLMKELHVPCRSPCLTSTQEVNQTAHHSIPPVAGAEAVLEVEIDELTTAHAPGQEATTTASTPISTPRNALDTECYLVTYSTYSVALFGHSQQYKKRLMAKPYVWVWCGEEWRIAGGGYRPHAHTRLSLLGAMSSQLFSFFLALTFTLNCERTRLNAHAESAAMEGNSTALC